MIKELKIFRCCWLIILVLLLGFLLLRAIVPNGQLAYQVDFSKPTYIFTQLLPAERVVKVDSGQELIAEPVYFSLYTPRTFNQVTVTLEFANPPSLVNFGIARNKASWLYDFKTLYNPALVNDQAITKLTNGDYETKLNFDLTKAERLNHRYTFMFSAPQLDQTKTDFIVKQAKFEFTGSTWKSFLVRSF